MTDYLIFFSNIGLETLEIYTYLPPNLSMTNDILMPNFSRYTMGGGSIKYDGNATLYKFLMNPIKESKNKRILSEVNLPIIKRIYHIKEKDQIYYTFGVYDRDIINFISIKDNNNILLYHNGLDMIKNALNKKLKLRPNFADMLAENGNLSQLKWSYSIGKKINRHNGHYEVYPGAKDYIQTVRWVFRLDPYIPNTIDISAYAGSIRSVKWFLNMGVLPGSDYKNDQKVKIFMKRL
jgi:hypothetical protein